MWIPHTIYCRLPLIYGTSGVMCLLVFELEVASIVSASCLFASAQLTDVWRRRNSSPPDGQQSSLESTSSIVADSAIPVTGGGMGVENDVSSRIALAESLVGVRFPAKIWCATFLASLDRQPGPADLILMSALLNAILAWSPKSEKAEKADLAPEVTAILIGALLGRSEYRGCLASRLPVYRLTGHAQSPQLPQLPQLPRWPQLPQLCTDGELRSLLADSSRGGAHPTLSLATIAIHRTAASVAFRSAPAAN